METHGDETRGLTVEGDVILEGPRHIKPAAQPGLDRGDGVSDPVLRMWLRCRIDSMRVRPAEAPLIERLQPNTVPVIQLETEFDEQLGVSRGLANERFSLRFGNVRPETLEIGTRSPSDEEQIWTLADSLANAEPMDKVFTLDIGGEDRPAVISFGDGLHGDIPPDGWTVVASRYRHGGGVRGNVTQQSVI